MFDLADGSACLWRRLAGHFAEHIPACGASCGGCLKRDIIAEARAAAAPAARAGRGTPQPMTAPAADPELFERLRALRKMLADGRQVPAFVVFSDRSLQDMAARKPRTRDELLEVHGVGQRKLEEYGDAFLAEILQAAPQ
jgi:ATP-dependent DNA helicase RecQ